MQDIDLDIISERNYGIALHDCHWLHTSHVFHSTASMTEEKENHFVVISFLA